MPKREYRMWTNGMLSQFCKCESAVLEYCMYFNKTDRADAYTCDILLSFSNLSKISARCGWRHLCVYENENTNPTIIICCNAIHNAVW